MSKILYRQIIAYLYYLLSAKPNELTKIMLQNGYTERNKIEFCSDVEKWYREYVIKR